VTVFLKTRCNSKQRKRKNTKEYRCRIYTAAWGHNLVPISSVPEKVLPISVGSYVSQSIFNEHVSQSLTIPEYRRRCITLHCWQILFATRGTAIISSIAVKCVSLFPNFLYISRESHETCLHSRGISGVPVIPMLRQLTLTWKISTVIMSWWLMMTHLADYPASADRKKKKNDIDRHDHCVRTDL